MPSTNPSSTRLSRSTSDLPGVNCQRTPESSSSRMGRGKDALPRAKIQALEQFVKFGRKGKQNEKDKSTKKATEFPPSVWFDSSTPNLTTSLPAAANTVRNSAARTVLSRDNSSPLPLSRAPPQRPSRTGSTTGLEPPEPGPKTAQNASRRCSPRPSRALWDQSRTTRFFLAQQHSLARTPTRQSPLPSRGAFKPCLTLRQRNKHRRHL